MVNQTEVFCPLLETCTYAAVWLSCNFETLRKLTKEDAFRNRLAVWSDYVCQACIQSLKQRTMRDINSRNNEWRSKERLYDKIVETGIIRHVDHAESFEVMQELFDAVLFDPDITAEAFRASTRRIRHALRHAEGSEQVAAVLLDILTRLHETLNSDIQGFYAKRLNATNAVLAQAILLMHRTMLRKEVRHHRIVDGMSQLSAYYQMYSDITAPFATARSLMNEDYMLALLNFLSSDFDPVEEGLIVPSNKQLWTLEFEVTGCLRQEKEHD